MEVLVPKMRLGRKVDSLHPPSRTDASRPEPSVPGTSGIASGAFKSPRLRITSPAGSAFSPVTDLTGDSSGVSGEEESSVRSGASSAFVSGDQQISDSGQLKK